MRGAGRTLHELAVTGGALPGGAVAKEWQWMAVDGSRRQWMAVTVDGSGQQ